MGSYPTCPKCHEPLKDVRLGVRLPMRKAQIVDFIRENGGSATQNEIAKHLGITLDAVRSHIYQINDLLAETDYEIRSQRLDRSGSVVKGRDRRGDKGRRINGRFSFVGYEVVKRKEKY